LLNQFTFLLFSPGVRRDLLDSELSLPSESQTVTIIIINKNNMHPGRNVRSNRHLSDVGAV